MTNRLLKQYGLTGTRLAKMTGQHHQTISRKLHKSQGLSLGTREAGILACFSVMTIEQKAIVGAVFEKVLKDISKL